MIDKRRLLVNAGSSVVQIFVTGVTLFLLYKYLLEILGAEILGVWSLVLAVGSVSVLANMGFTGSIVKYVASYDAVDDRQKVISAIETSVISIGTVGIVLIGVLYLVSDLYFSFALEEGYRNSAVDILPLALLCFWLMLVTGIYQGALYGCQLIDQRNIVLMVDSVLHLIWCLILSSEYGLIGLAYARLIQNIITLSLSWYLLKRRLPELPLIPVAWERTTFKEMLGYSANFQLITLLVMMSDPITKGFLSKFGSVSMVSYYEMSNKLVQLCRSVIVNANQVLVPSFASLKELEPEKIQAIYLKSNQVVFFLSVPIFCFLLVASPLISQLWIGAYEPSFVFAMMALSLGWMFNTLSVPAYFAGVGTGELKDNVLCHLIMTALNLALIGIIGSLWEGGGVIGAWAISLAIGGFSLNLLYFRRNNIKIGHLIPHDSWLLLILSFLGLGLTYIFWNYQREYQLVVDNFYSELGSTNGLFFYTSLILCFSVCVFVPIWIHPIRKGLMGLVLDRKSLA